jgi:hypothetical protein
MVNSTGWNLQKRK